MNPFARRLNEASVVMEGTPHPELVEMLRIGAEEIERLQERLDKGSESLNARLWKVSVLCEGIIPALIGVKRPKPSRLERRWTTVIVEATSNDAAMAAAKEYADCNAGPDVRWEAFTPMSAARFVLPAAVEDLR